MIHAPIDVLPPEPSPGPVARVELLSLDPCEYRGLRYATSLVARELLAFSFGPADDQLFGVGTLGRLLGLSGATVVAALRELHRHMLIRVELGEFAAPRPRRAVEAEEVCKSPTARRTP